MITMKTQIKVPKDFDGVLIAIEKEGLTWELERDFVNYAVHFSLWNYNTLAKQTRPLLKEKLAGEWQETLGIKGKPEEYFYNKQEYHDFLDAVK